MDELLELWQKLRREKRDRDSDDVWQVTLDDLAERLMATFREVYSEGHCDGQNAMADDPDHPTDSDIAWAQSQSMRSLAQRLR